MAAYKVEIIEQSEDHLGEGDCHALHFYYDGREICTVMLAPVKEGGYETHISDLPHDLISKGLGVEVYKEVFSYCLENKMPLSSSKSRCDDAERLWKSIRLNKMFEIREGPERYYLLAARSRKIPVA